MAQASVEKLEHTELAEKKSWPQCHRESSWQVRNEKEQSRQSRASTRKGKESQGERESSEIGARVWRREGRLHIEGRQIPRRRRRASEKSPPRGRRKHQATAASTWWGGPRPHLDLAKMAVGIPEGPSYPGHSPLFFRRAAP